MCAACSIISVLTQWGATLVIKVREREREGEREREREKERESSPLSTDCNITARSSLAQCCGAVRARVVVGLLEESVCAAESKRSLPEGVAPQFVAGLHRACPTLRLSADSPRGRPDAYDAWRRTPSSPPMRIGLERNETLHEKVFLIPFFRRTKRRSIPADRHKPTRFASIFDARVPMRP